MKIYRHKTDPKTIGVKYEDIRRTMVQISAEGSLDTAVKLTLTSREKDNDFNADSCFMKDYDAEIHGIFAELLGVDENSELRYKKFMVKYLPTHDVEVSVIDDAETNGVGIGDYTSTVERLISHLNTVY